MPHATLIYTLSTKPEAHYLHVHWKRKLAQGDGLNLDTNRVSSRMAYWAGVPNLKPDKSVAAYENAGQDADTKLSYDLMMSKFKRYSHHYFSTSSSRDHESEG